MIYDVMAAAGAYFFALWFRFDCQYTEIPDEYLASWLSFVPIYAVASVIVLFVFKLYRSIWEFAGFDELKRVVFASGVLGAFHTVLITVLFRRMPISYYVIGIVLQFLLLTFVRFSYRFVSMERRKSEKLSQALMTSRVMLIGAGSAGQMILRDLQNSKGATEYVCCIIDDDKKKQGRLLEGVPIVGGREDILLNVKKYKVDKIYLTMPGATAEQRRDILNICKETTCQLKSLPSIAEMVSADVSMHSMREVAVEDLLGRDPVKVNMDEIYRFVADKVILVTGGGGSIGSELCRQIAQHHPKQLIVFDIYENNAHAIGLELQDMYPELNLEVLIGSVRDSRRLDQVFSKYQPDVVYHAAAHKHVPLMEDSPCESIKNNAIGTYKTAYAAMMHGCKRFVLISTDKAVNPTNIMGATKRICEMIIQTIGRHSKHTNFVAVRFGNVLGSNGSVIPLFKKQIAHGGPVTVTHKDIIRYFMTIPEAVSLVLQAGAYAQSGQIFVLDMGEPVKIYDLAYNLIKMSGLEPNVDIQIVCTGLRPGEKLFEERLMAEEGLQKTANGLINIAKPLAIDEENLWTTLDSLYEAAYSETDSMKEWVKRLVPTYTIDKRNGAKEILEKQAETAVTETTAS
jgi:FlaA1/EpsC-like NDP-sugar epimerase